MQTLFPDKFSQDRALEPKQGAMEGFLLAQVETAGIARFCEGQGTGEDVHRLRFPQANLFEAFFDFSWKASPRGNQLKIIFNEKILATEKQKSKAF